MREREREEVLGFVVLCKKDLSVIFPSREGVIRHKHAILVKKDGTVFALSHPHFSSFIPSPNPNPNLSLLQFYFYVYCIYVNI